MFSDRYYERVRQAKPILDTKIWDDVTKDEQGNIIKGAGREAAAKASRAKKLEEAKALAKANAEFKRRVSAVGSVGASR